MPGLVVYERIDDHNLDCHATAAPMAGVDRSDRVLATPRHADVLDTYVPGPADGIGHEALAACVEPLTVQGKVPRDGGRPVPMEVHIQLV